MTAITPSTPLGSFHQSPFWRLRARFRDYGLFDSELAQATGIAQSTLSRRMRGTMPWTSDEIKTICRVLNIPQEQVGAYFFPDIEKEESQ